MSNPKATQQALILGVFIGVTGTQALPLIDWLVDFIGPILRQDAESLAMSIMDYVNLVFMLASTVFAGASAWVGFRMARVGRTITRSEARLILVTGAPFLLMPLGVVFIAWYLLI